MQNNLSTTIKAYFKLSPSELDNYVKKVDLDTELKDYVKEAPTDGFTYGRRDKQWVELEASAVRNTRLRWGTSIKEIFKSYGVPDYEPEDDVTTLPFRADLYQSGKDTYIKVLNISVPVDSYVWVCCSHKVINIQCQYSGGIDGNSGGESIAGIWDYQLIPDKTVTGSDGVPYYCYRTSDMLSAGNNWTLIVEVNAHKESD